MDAFTAHRTELHRQLAEQLGAGFELAGNPLAGVLRRRPHGEEFLSFTLTAHHLPACHAYLNFGVRYTAANEVLARTGLSHPEHGLCVIDNSGAIVSRRQARGRWPSYIGWRQRVAWWFRRPPGLAVHAIDRPPARLVATFAGFVRGAVLPFFDHFRTLEAARRSLEADDGDQLGLAPLPALVVIDVVLRDREHLARLGATRQNERDRKVFEECMAKVAAYAPDLVPPRP